MSRDVLRGNYAIIYNSILFPSTLGFSQAVTDGQPDNQTFRVHLTSALYLPPIISSIQY